MTADPSTTSGLVHALRGARTIAIVGASDDGAKPSGRTQRYLVRYGYDGVVYPINPTREIVQGARAYPSLDDVPTTPDLAVIVVSADRVEEAVRACGRVGCRLAIVFASGYAEVTDGVERQASLARVAAEAGVRVIGPNCVGAVAAPAVTAAFMSGLDQDRFELADDGVAFVSQSGAMGAFILNMAQSDELGVGLFVSTGNEMDVTLSSLVADLAADPGTAAVLGYVEGIRDGQVFVDALASADEHDVPVCLLKVGTSERGAAAAASHTGSLAGADRVYDGVFARHGVQRAETVEDLLDLGRVFAAPRRPAGNRVTIVTLSGGAGALMTDEAATLDLDVAPWDDTWRATMAAGLPPFASTTNPVDATGVIGIDDAALTHCLEVAAAHPATDVVVLVMGNLDAEEERVCRTIVDAAATTDKPVVVTWVGGSGLAPRLLNAAGVPTFADPRRAMRAVAALVRHTTRRTHPPLPPPPAVTWTRDDGVDEVAAKRLLSTAGIRTVDEREVTTVDEAVETAAAMGHPVVLKLLSSEVGHKSELGGVRLRLLDDAAVREAAEDVLAIAADHRLADRRLVVQAMVESPVELILGSSTDPVFGPVTMLGIGGVHAELLDDVAVRPSPLSVAEAHDMIDSLRGVPLLRGARNGRAVDEHALADTVAAFSRLSAGLATRVASIEVNPLAFAHDGTPVALDALIVPREDA